jgi:hypothetical protein
MLLLLLLMPSLTLGITGKLRPLLKAVVFITQDSIALIVIISNESGGHQRVNMHKQTRTMRDCLSSAISRSSS